MMSTLSSNVARALLAGSLAVSPGLSSTYAHILARPGAAAGHVAMGTFHGPLGAHRGSSWRGWSGRGWDGRRGLVWSGYGRDHWGHGAWSGRDHGIWSGRGHYAWTGRGEYGQGGWGYYPWLWGSGFGGGYGAVSATAAEPIVIVVDGGAPQPASSVYPSASSDLSPHGGGCVIHQLEYDSAGNYVGDRETPNC